MRVLPGTRAAELVLNAGGDRVTAVRCIRNGASDCIIHAAEVVLAAGAIENARLLMQLERPLSPMLGIGFMEHPMDRSLQLRSRDPALSPTPGFYHFAREGVHRHLIGRIGLTAELQAAEQLVNASVRLFPMPVSRMTRARRALAGVLGRIPSTPYRVVLDLEQLPARGNRIHLTESRDMQGLRAVELAWSWSGADAARHERVVTVLTRELGHAGVTVYRGAPVLDPNAHHHAGLTRMHVHPDGGVVNADLRVHEVANLHVSGASVFPTAGVANPTLTIIALGLRLGAHLAHL
jgi:choline dehydrogenase-like flavoprotein